MKRRKAKPKITLKEYLESHFEELVTASNLESDLPRKWEKHGDLILLPHNCFTREEWMKLDQGRLWDVVAQFFSVSRIAKKGRICDNGHRTPQVVMLKGQDSWVCHVDNRIRYSYDVTKCMFSAGNITEKMRMAKLKCKEEVIVDMFAGIGYFTLPLLVHAKAKFVHACEWNRDAVVALKKNLSDNKVDHLCSVHEGDNKKVCPEDVADRVIMGLIPSAMGSLEAACKALKQGQGGVLHIHHNVDSKIQQNRIALDLKSENHELSCNKEHILPEWTIWARETALLVEETMKKLRLETDLESAEVKTDIVHIEKVKSYAPHIDHMVLDLNVTVNR